MRKKYKKPSPKANSLIKTAQELFFLDGTKKVSVEKICIRAGISRMTFYRHFSNKAALARYIIESIYKQAGEQIKSILYEDLPFEERIRKMLIMKLEMSDKYSKEFMNELVEGSDTEIKEYIEEENRKSLDEIKKVFSKAQKKGEIRRDIKIDFLIYMMNVMKKVFYDKDLLKLYPDSNSLMKETFNFFYYGVLSRK